MKQLADRYDGIAKVTGKARYAAEFSQPFSRKDLLYAYMVQSTIPSGSIAAIDQKAAERAPGVVAIITPFNAPKLNVGPPQPPARRTLSLLQDTQVFYNGQPIALVVATTLDQAQAGANLLKISYKSSPARLDFKAGVAAARLPKLYGKEPPRTSRGDVDAALAKAYVKVDNVYITPIQNHNPMETHATLAWWEGEKLSVYDSTQFIDGAQATLARILSIPVDDVRVQCPYTGGGFGCKGSTWSHVILSAMAAKIVQKPVKLVLDRGQMFGPVGGRPATVNHIQIGAGASGKITAIKHEAVMTASAMEDFVEPVTDPSRILYSSDTNFTSEKMVELNYGIGTFMRAPGDSPGTATLEIAMDELAEKLKIDPVQLRLINHADEDPDKRRPWTSKHLKECYEQGAERFGWSKRNSTPGQISEGNLLIGFGMASATYPANRSACQAVVRILPNGRAFVGSATHELGTGAYTIMAQTAAAGLGIDPALVDVKLGDSTLPKAPVAGGSQSTASYGPAIDDAAQQVRLKLIQLAVNDQRSPLYKPAATALDIKSIDVKDGRLFLRSDPQRFETFTALLERNGGKPVEAVGSAEPGENRNSMTSQSFGAVFAEVAVDKTTSMVQVRRIVATYDIGTLFNDKLGRSQFYGGIVWGVGFALHEAAIIDKTYGRTVNESLAEYHVPVNADIGQIDVTVLNIPDTTFSPLGGRGIGEIGITGVMSAIANAVYNATGKRVREYPITPDKIMSA